MSFLISDAYAEAAPAATGSDPISSLIFFGGFLGSRLAGRRFFGGPLFLSRFRFRGRGLAFRGGLPGFFFLGLGGFGSAGGDTGRKPQTCQKHG